MSNLRRLALSICLASASWSEAASPPVFDGLLRTHWRQDGPFAQFTPDHAALGCWSTAYAQILYYHRLTPTGRVKYECSSGYDVDVDLDRYRFDLDHFAIGAEGDSPASLEQAALYSYATAVVVQKDFGVGKYKRLLNSVGDLEAHFPVDAEMYVVLGDKLPLTRADLDEKLRSEKVERVVGRDKIVDVLDTELAARRPVYFHFGNMTDFGHSTVIDGIRRHAGKVLVHINYGAAEVNKSAWYELFAPISQPDDVALRAFVTIRPTGRGATDGSTSPPQTFDPTSDVQWRRRLEEVLARRRVPAAAIAVIRGGRVAASVVAGEREAGKPADRDTLFNVASLTKPVFLHAMLALVDRGIVTLDDPLSKDWIDPDLRGDRRVERLSARVVLAHQTGFPNWRGDNGLKFDFTPGEGVRYSGEGFEYLRRAVEAKTGRTMAQLVAENVFASCGMTDSHFTWDASLAARYAFEHDDEGRRVSVPTHATACAADDLLTTIGDYGRFAAFVARGANLSPPLLKEMSTPQARAAARANADGPSDYGLGWRVVATEHAAVLVHGGADRGVRAGVLINPQSGDGVVVMTNGDGGGGVIEEIVPLAIPHGAEILAKYLDP